MKTLYILKKEPDNNINTIMSENEKESEVLVVDLQENQDYDALVEHIETCDRLITW